MATTSSGSAQRNRKRPEPKQARSSSNAKTKSANRSTTTARASRAQSSSGSSQKSSSSGSAQKSPASASVPVPYVTAQWHTTRIALPDLPGRDDLTSTVSAVRGAMPSSKQLLFYGGLTAAAALSVIEWPVAAAIGIGTAVLGRNSDQDGE